MIPKSLMSFKYITFELVIFINQYLKLQNINKHAYLEQLKTFIPFNFIIRALKIP